MTSGPSSSNGILRVYVRVGVDARLLLPPCLVPRKHLARIHGLIAKQVAGTSFLLLVQACSACVRLQVQYHRAKAAPPPSRCVGWVPLLLPSSSWSIP